MARIPALDISIWDGGIDLEAWKRLHGIQAVIVKCGGSEGRRYADPCFSDHMRKAQEARLPAGVYYYTTSTTVADAIADADHCASIIRNYDLQLPVFMDVEDSGQLGMSKRALTDVIKAFCDRIQHYGLRAGIYTFGSMWLNNMHPDELRQYTTWIASWQESWPSYVGEIDAWQQGTKRLSDGHVYYDDMSGCQDFDWLEDYVIQGGGAGMGKIDPANVAALIHYDMVTDPRNGYSQAPERWGGDHPDGTKVLDIDGRRYTYKLGSYDCSSSVITAWRQALRYTMWEGVLDGATYTGDMRGVFTRSGLFEAKYSAAKRGDLYLAEQKHTAMCQDGGSDGVLGYDALSEFNRNESHGATGGQVGDQDGGESIVRDYYDDGWNTVLHYVGGMLDDVSGKHDQKESEEDEMKDVRCILQAPKGDKLYYFDGAKTRHIGPDQLKGLQVVFKSAGVPLRTVEVPQVQIDAMTRL